MCQVHFIKHLTSFSSSVRTFTEEQLINKMYPNKGQEDSDNTGMFRLASVEMMLPIFLLVSCRFCQQLKQKEITPKLSASITLPASHSYSHQSSDQTTDLGILQTYTSPPFQLSKSFSHTSPMNFLLTGDHNVCYLYILMERVKVAQCWLFVGLF